MTYYVKYKTHQYAEPKGVCIPAKSKIEAYCKAVFEVIFKREGGLPYSAWVESVTYNNGKYRQFYTHEGKPY